MQIIIDMTDNIYTELTKTGENEINLGILLALREAVRQGKPLPKGHGKLKDENEIVKAIQDRVEFLRKNDAIFMRLRKDIDILGCIPKIRCEVPTIIEADKEQEA